MAKVEIKEFGVAGDGEKDRITIIDVLDSEYYPFEIEDPPSIRRKGTNVELKFPKKKSIVINENGSLVYSPIEIFPGKSVIMRPFHPFTRISEIPDTKITHLLESSRKDNS